MATITYTSLTNLVNATVTAANAEALIDQAKNELNAYGLTLPSSTGASGSKSWVVTDEEEAAILAVAMEYYQYYKTSGSSSESYGLGGMNYAVSSATGGGLGRIHEVAQNFARQLLEVDVSVG